MLNKVLNLLTGWGCIRFSRRNVHHGYLFSYYTSNNTKQTFQM